MKAKVIKTKAEYETALARIEKLMDVTPHTPQGDELELLSLLVHDYEEKNFPIDKPQPSDHNDSEWNNKGSPRTLFLYSAAAVGSPRSSLAGAASALQ